MDRPTHEELREQLSRIEFLIGNRPEGMGMRALVAAYADETGQRLPERTMLRRVAALMKDGRVLAIGEARARRYSPPNQAPPSARTSSGGSGRSASIAVAAPRPGQEEGSVPLSGEGRSDQALVGRPIAARQPVGYDEAFLRSYEPGMSAYLPESMRHALHELGRTPDPARPAGTFAREIFERLLVDLAWASSRLEGNTYSRLDTKNLLQLGIRAEGKAAAEAQMILNHKKAIELLVDEAEDIGFNRYTLLNLHAALSENLLGDSSDEGRIRRRPVHITGTTYLPLAIPQKLEELFDLLLEKTAAIPDPFEQAFFVMVHVPYLQPFSDVNKRTSRLAANISLIKANLCPMSFVDVPERTYVEAMLAVYEYTRVAMLRDLFAWAYARSCAQYRVVRDSMGEPDPIRLRHRELLNEMVVYMVRGLHAPRRPFLESWGGGHGVPPSDMDAFVETALDLLLSLHEGAIARYRLRPKELRAWKDAVSSSA